MSRRTRRERQRRDRFVVSPPTVYRGRRRAAPVSSPERRRFTVTINHYRDAKRARALGSPVLLPSPRTVRPLIRTVLRDTPVRRTAAIAPRSLRRRYTGALESRARDYYPTRPWQIWLDDLAPAYREQDLVRAEHCARRSIRREVLFSQRTLNGAGGRGKPKSDVRC